MNPDVVKSRGDHLNFNRYRIASENQRFIKMTTQRIAAIIVQLHIKVGGKHGNALFDDVVADMVRHSDCSQ